VYKTIQSKPGPQKGTALSFVFPPKDMKAKVAADVDSWTADRASQFQFIDPRVLGMAPLMVEIWL
jgi:hypothetical protein